MATYNRAHFIVETLQSIKAQTYIHWECLIIDDGSSDNKETILKPILKADNRFKYYKRPASHKKGLPGSRNYGLELANGDYIIFFDDDDIVHPLCLEIGLSTFKNYENSFFCNYKKEAFSGTFNYGSIESNKEYNLEATTDDLLEKVLTQTTPFASCTVLWKKECFKEHMFNEDLMYAEEWECYLRILCEKFKGVIIDKILYFNRKHPNSNTGEFWRNAPFRVNSKKRAIELVVRNLYKKNLLTPYLFKYLVNLAISFRDCTLVKNILILTNQNTRLKLFYKLKYYLYPIWLFYMKIKKHKS